MKIAYDHTIFLIQKYGGISRYFNELAKNLNDKYNVKIFSPIHLNEMINSNNNTFKIKKINSIPKFSNKLLNYLNFIINEIYFYKWKPNIIHKTYFNSYKYKNKAKKIINVWDLSHEKFHFMYNKSKNWKPKNLSLNQVDHVICSSINTQKELSEYYNFDYKKTSVVYQCPPDLNYKVSLNKNKEKFLLYVGSRLKYKNFENLLKALSLNKNILQDFKLICFGTETLSKREKFLINSYNLNKKNIIFENGNDLKLAKYYINATALIYPSKNEGFGYPPLEAMKYGCPVISSNNKAILEATNLEKYTFDPYDPNDIIKKIEDIIYSKNEINHLTEYGLNRAKKFTRSNMIEDIKKVYEKVVNC